MFFHVFVAIALVVLNLCTRYFDSHLLVFSSDRKQADSAVIWRRNRAKWAELLILLPPLRTLLSEWRLLFLDKLIGHKRVARVEVTRRGVFRTSWITAIEWRLPCPDKLTGHKGFTESDSQTLALFRLVGLLQKNDRLLFLINLPRTDHKSVANTAYRDSQT